MANSQLWASVDIKILKLAETFTLSTNSNMRVKSSNTDRPTFKKRLAFWFKTEQKKPQEKWGKETDHVTWNAMTKNLNKELKMRKSTKTDMETKIWREGN